MKGSLRARLFAGALVWMIAVFVTVTALLLKLTRHHPEFGVHGETYHAVMGIFAVDDMAGIDVAWHVRQEPTDFP